MPKVTSWYSQTQEGTWCRETFNGNIIINGTYHDAATLAPKLGRFDYVSDAGTTNMQTQVATNTQYPSNPNFYLRGGVNWNMPYGGCWYYVSGFGKLTTGLRDNTMFNRQYYLNLGKNSLDTWTGSMPGWGYVFSSGFTDGGNTYNTTQIYDDTTDTAAFNSYGPAAISAQGLTAGFMFANVAVAGTPLNANVQVVGPNTDGSVYRWSYGPGTTAAGTVGGTTTANMFNFLPNQTSVGAYNPLHKDAYYGHNAITTTDYGTSSTTRHTQILTFTSNLVYFIEHTLSASAGTGNVNLTNVFFVKKMTYAGTETTITSHPQWMYGLKLPTPMLNETTLTANVVYPLFNTVTANASYGNISLMRLDISKVLNSETLNLMSITNSPGQRIYNLLGVSNTIAPGTYNDTYWKYHSMFRTWNVTGTGGQNYLMMSFENTGYSLASYNNNNNLTTLPATIYNNTVLNDNGGGFARSQCFKIWSFTIDANYTSAVYQAESDFGNVYPRWYYPLRSDGMIQYMAAMDGTMTDRVIRFNESTYQWSIVNTLPYRADTVGIDSNSRIWVSSTYGANPVKGYGLSSLYLEGNVLPQIVTITPYSTSYSYSGGNITTNLSVSTTNIFGNLVAANVVVSLTGGMVFANGTTSAYIATSNTSVVTANTIVVSTAPINITGTISGYF